jgi:hypothetical protein
MNVKHLKIIIYNIAIKSLNIYLIFASNLINILFNDQNNFIFIDL